MQLATSVTGLCPASRRVAGPASTSARVARPRAGVKVQAYSVTFNHKGKKTVLEVGPDESILEVALDKGLDVTHDCKMGVCMTCPGKMVSGTVKTGGSMLSEDVAAQGYVLLCCAMPEKDCEVTTIDEDELLELQLNG